MKSVYAIETPIGTMTAEEEDGCVTALHLPGLPHPEYGGKPQTDLAHELGEYFTGGRKAFGVPYHIVAHGFTYKAMTAALEIPYGSTTTYAALAAAAGSPRAVRAAGQAMARNPLPILVPCHRVLYSTGKRQQYAGGPEMKDFLLKLEEKNK